MEEVLKKRIVKNIYVSKDLRSKVKTYAKKHGMTASGLATQALVEYFD